jgi:YVTN family beta-propeller protein
MSCTIRTKTPTDHTPTIATHSSPRQFRRCDARKERSAILDDFSNPIAILALRLKMQNSRTLEQSKSSTNVRFHWRAIALVIATAIGVWGCGGGTGQSSNNPPPTPTPTITTISPNSAVTGGAAFTLTINGTNFVAGAMVNFGGAAPATTFVSSAQLTAAISASSIASAGTLAVTVINPAPGGGTSNPVNFTITGGGPSSIPALDSFYPNCVPAGEQLVDSVNNQLVVSGDNFVASSVVRWNGADLPTSPYPDSQGTILIAQVPASDIAAAGTAAVTVFNPPPGGGTSNSLTFTTTPGGVDPRSIAVDSAGKFAYVANAGCAGGVVGYVSMYTINPATGALAPIAPPVSSLDYTAESVTLDPSGKFAYVANAGDDETSDGSVVSYTINATTGALTSTASIMGNCPGICVPESVAVDPSGKFAYVPNGAGEPNSIVMFTINATTGALTSTGTIAVDGFAVTVAVHPSGKFAYLATASSTPGAAGNVAMFTINAATGALTSIGTVAAGTINAESAPTSIVVDPTGKFAYVANFGSNDVSMYTINTTTGILTSRGSIAAGTIPLSVAVDPTGKFAYVTNFQSNDVSMYTINATSGALTSAGTVATGQNPASVTVHPSGKFAYVTNQGSNSVSMYSVDTTSGALSPTGTVATGTQPLSVALDPAGKFAYVVNLISNDVSMYSVGTDGSLTSLGTIAAGTSPTSVVVHPSGGFVYVTNSGSNDISVYSIDSGTGLLTLVGTTGS